MNRCRNRIWQNSAFYFMLKILKKLGLEGSFLSLKKHLQKNKQNKQRWLIAQLPVKDQKSLPSNIGTRQRCTFSPFLTNIILKVFSRAIRKEKIVIVWKSKNNTITNYPMFIDQKTKYCKNSGSSQIVYIFNQNTIWLFKRNWQVDPKIYLKIQEIPKESKQS